MSENAKVLIVDDTPQNIELMYQMLTIKGYSVAGAPSGQIALNIVHEFKPDVILMDVMMPEMDGYETCERLKADPNVADIPVIFVTAKVDAESIARGFECGGEDYISKPAKEAELWARVENQLKIRQLMQSKDKLIRRLARLQARSREIVNRASDAMLMLGSSGEIESVNPAAIHLFGYSDYKLIGRKLVELISKDYRKAYDDSFSGHGVLEQGAGSLVDKGARQISVINSRKENVPVDLSISQIGFEKAYYFCLFHDMSMHSSLLKQLRAQTEVDNLTQLANRRKLDTFLAAEWQRTSRSEVAISILFLDIDYFKPYNDYYGHIEGDNCLRKVARLLLEKICRPTDLVARYGGEEFVVVLPDTNKEGANSVAESVLSAFEAEGIPHQKSAIKGFVTCSIGVATGVAGAHQPPSELIARADKALYQAKQNGRNSVCCYSTLNGK